MKKLHFILFSVSILLAIESTHAQVITVDNNPNSAADYTDLQLAIDEASPGDTIYISGSTDTYGDIDVTKKLVLIGAGYAENDPKQVPTVAGHLRLKVTSQGDPNNDSSGSVISGFKATHIEISVSQDVFVEDIVIVRNYVTNNIQAEFARGHIRNWLIANNIIGDAVNLSEGSTSPYDPTAADIIISNNIFSGGRVLYGVRESIQVVNNIFLRNPGSSSATQSSFNSNEQTYVANNIFYGVRISLPSGNPNESQLCYFRNNISFNDEGTSFSFLNNTSENNQENVDPLFVIEEDLDFDFEEDYHLSPGSPGKNEGTDGNDIGIYGGLYPWPSQEDVPFANNVFPSIPQVIDVSIITGSVPLDGTLEVEVKATSSN